MPKKVKFFESNNIFNLETQVNEFLYEIDHYNIIDIKYNTCIGEESSSNYGQMIYTVMVMYDKEEYPTKSVPEGTDNVAQAIFKNADGMVSVKKKDKDPV